MKVQYDKETDSLTITPCDEGIKESKEIRVKITYDPILPASKREYLMDRGWQKV